MSELSELREVLGDLISRLERVGAQAATAIPLLERAKAILVAGATPGDGPWPPSELDVAIGEIRRIGELLAMAGGIVSDYAGRL